MPQVAYYVYSYVKMVARGVVKNGEPINIYDPKSTGAMAYQALAKEVMARNKKK